MSKNAVVLLSGGLDSTLCLYLAHESYGVACALTVDYGQRAFSKEREAAAASCEALGVEHKVLDLESLFALTTSSLVDLGKAVPTGADVNITDSDQSQATAKSVWVPNRNGVFLSLAACLAESMNCKYVVPGFNKEEAETFPDNSADFVTAFNAGLKYSTMNQVEVVSPTQEMNKAEMYKMARDLNIPKENIWSCYQAFDEPCGVCESCLRTQRAKESFQNA